MGRYKPGVEYIYERVDDVIYAREFGGTDRFEIGRDYKKQQINWYDVIEQAKENPTLQDGI